MSNGLEIKNSSISVLKLVLRNLELDTLANIFYNYDLGTMLSPKVTKSFIINRLINEVPSEKLLSNSIVLNEMIEMFNKMTSSLTTILKKLSLENLKTIYKELKKEDIPKTSKKEIIEELVTNIGLSKVWETKTFKRQLKPKSPSKTYLRNIRKEVVALRQSMEHAQKKNNENLSNQLDRLSNDLTNILTQIFDLKSNFQIGEHLKTEDFLRTFYNQSLDIEYPPSPEDIVNISKNLEKNYGTLRWNLFLKGLDVLTLHYLLVNIKSLKWKPLTADFLRITREEYEKIKGVGGQAEIPELRTNVCTRMNLSHKIFDEMLTDLWKNGSVRLDVGAPIGISEVKYLKTNGGNLFFYVKFIR